MKNSFNSQVKLQKAYLLFHINSIQLPHSFCELLLSFTPKNTKVKVGQLISLFNKLSLFWS